MREVGFTYATLSGHAERGIATFLLRMTSGGGLTFHIEAWSQPGNWASVLFRPLARRIQTRFSREALERFAAEAGGTTSD